ncbi:hypothetical protein PG997_011419 [Apiospora hydei]|uniref:Uncharacterized protein n=1 Tax=Apiospora hydei TaxID=1337664 RepID=A0ABR1VIZ7_9PEZI
MASNIPRMKTSCITEVTGGLHGRIIGANSAELGGAVGTANPWYPHRTIQVVVAYRHKPDYTMSSLVTTKAPIK